MITLKQWQEEAMSKIKSVLKGCIVEAATGTGKTVLGLKLLEECPNDKKVLIVVPTIVLQKQWKNEIVNVFKIAEDKDISLLGGGHQDIPSTKIAIAVVDSLRNINWKNKISQFDIVICDEVHRYAAPTNFRFLKEGSFGFVLGLTATLNRSDGMETLLIKEIGPVVYRINNREAIDQGYVADFTLKIVACGMTQLESNKHRIIQSDLSNLMSLFNGNLNTIKSTIRAGYRHVNFRHAVNCMKLIQERKAFLTSVESKHVEAIKLIAAQPDKKWIIFDEVQESANSLYQTLIDLGFKAVIYHSKIGAKEKKKAIEQYRNDEVNILVSVKALDEGLDVKGAECGLIVNGNSQARQVKQRLGRILRKSGDKVGQLFMLYVPGTQDEKYINKRVEALGESMEFEDDMDDF